MLPSLSCPPRFGEGAYVKGEWYVRENGRPATGKLPPIPIQGSGGPSGGSEGRDIVPAARYVVTRDSRGRPRPVRAATDGEVEAIYPALWEFLTCQLVEDKGRLTSTLLVMAEDGQVKLCLSDRETDRVAWRSARTVREALQGLEEALAAGTAEWREKRPYTPKRG